MYCRALPLCLVSFIQSIFPPLSIFYATETACSLHAGDRAVLLIFSQSRAWEKGSFAVIPADFQRMLSTSCTCPAPTEAERKLCRPLYSRHRLILFTISKNGSVKIPAVLQIPCRKFLQKKSVVISINWNSDKTFFIAFINCYILSSKSPQTLENAKFIASEFALRLSLVLYPFP